MYLSRYKRCFPPPSGAQPHTAADRGRRAGAALLAGDAPNARAGGGTHIMRRSADDDDRVDDQAFAKVSAAAFDVAPFLPKTWSPTCAWLKGRLLVFANEHAPPYRVVDHNNIIIAAARRCCRVLHCWWRCASCRL
jgi:hypothetical protein